MDTILVDQVGFERLEKEIEAAEENLQKIRISRAEQMGQEHSSDAIMSNPIIFVLASQERQALRTIEELKRTRNHAKIITPEKNTNCVGLGSVVEILFLDDTNSTMSLKMVSNSPKEGEISLASPLGKAIYGHKSGDIVEYTVSTCVLMAKIVSIN